MLNKRKRMKIFNDINKHMSKKDWILLAAGVLIIVLIICLGGCQLMGTQQQQDLRDEFNQRSSEQEELVNELQASVDTDRREASDRVQKIEAVQGDLTTSVSEVRNEQTFYVTKTELEQTTIDIKKSVTVSIKETSQSSENEGWVIITCVGILTVAVLVLACMAGVFMFRLLKALIKGKNAFFG